MDLCNESCLSGQLTILRGKNFNIGHHTQTFQIGRTDGTIVFYHLLPLSLTLILVRGHEVSAKQNLLAPFSLTLFIRMKFDVVMMEFKLDILRLLLSEIY